MPTPSDAELRDGMPGSGARRSNAEASRGLPSPPRAAATRHRRQNRKLALLLAMVAASALLAVVGLVVVVHDADTTPAAHSASRATSIQP
jgi:hypothetical protein